jgi:uncharacterized membrane protein YiaA
MNIFFSIALIFFGIINLIIASIFLSYDCNTNQSNPIRQSATGILILGLILSLIGYYNYSYPLNDYLYLNGIVLIIALCLIILGAIITQNLKDNCNTNQYYNNFLNQAGIVWVSGIIIFIIIAIKLGLIYIAKKES